MDSDDLPDFLQLNRLSARPGMFGRPRGQPAADNPLAALAPDPADPFSQALSPLSGGASPPTAPFSYSPFVRPAAIAGQCPIVPLDAPAGSVVRNHADLRFSPTFADIVRRAAETLNRRGMRLNVNKGFRTAADQWRMRHGGSGRNPAAKYSDHQLGNAIDVNGTALASFPEILQAFTQAGAKWGGDYRGRKDPPHFYIRPLRANAINTAECERENPR